MPYKSKAQQRLFHAKAARGEMPKSTVDEFDKATNFKSLPSHKSKSLKHMMVSGFKKRKKLKTAYA